MRDTPSSVQQGGMRTFTLIWVSQVLSLLGTAMSGFALTFWVYGKSGQATPLALTGFFFVAPMTLLSPFIGAIVDRANRKLMMMLSDLTAAVTSLIILLLYLSGALQIWHLYALALVGGIMNGFQWPAYSAAISTMLHKSQYARANAMLETAGAASGIIAPLLAGALIGPVGVAGLLIIDLVTASIAITVLLFSHIPQPARTAAGVAAQGNFLKESLMGFGYIFSRPGLLGLQLIFMLGNLFHNLGYSVFGAMILGRTGNDAQAFGAVNSAGALGALLGGIVMSTWGGFRRRVHGVLLGWAGAALFGMIWLGLAQSLPFWAVGLFLGSAFSPLINGSNQAIWQAKVEPDIQGRVFGARRLIAWLVMPIASLLAGPLADKVFEPALREGGAAVPLFGRLVGVGPGAGIALMFVIFGAAALIVSLGGYLFPVIRNVETLIPDHDSALPAARLEPRAENGGDVDV